MENIKQTKAVKIIILLLIGISLLCKVIDFPISFKQGVSILSCFVLFIYIAFLMNKTREKLMMSIVIGLLLLAAIYSIYENANLLRISGYLGINIHDIVIAGLIGNIISFAFYIVLFIYFFVKKAILLKISTILAIVHIICVIVYFVMIINSHYSNFDFVGLLPLLSLISFYCGLFLFEFNKSKFKISK